MDNSQLNPTIDNDCWCSFYKITNKVNNKCYIGQTIRDPEIRFREHIHSSTQEDPGCRAIALALKSWGVDNFTFEVIWEEYSSHHDALEQLLIKEYNSLAPNGYNLYPGGKHTYQGHTGSVRDKISSNQRKYFDDVHDLPRYIMYIPGNDYGIGYSVNSPEIEFMQFSSNYFSLDEKYNFAIRYLTEENARDEIRKQYNEIKRIRKQENILKEVTIESEKYYLPSHFIWTSKGKYFLVRKPGKKAKQFGNTRITIRQNYERALAYYNNQ